MGYGKYLLSKTGLFPSLDPVAEDVLNAADKVFEVKDVVTSRRDRYFYIIPESYKKAYISELMSIFSSNGIILRPHHSKHYNCLLFRVPNRGQKFMYDVMRVCNNSKEFQNVLQEYVTRKQKVLFPRLTQKLRSR